MKVAEKKSIVVFETNDNNRSTHEYGKYAGREYFIPFTEFIESLGFEINRHSGIEDVNINGHRFSVNTNNASYMSQNSFNRDISIRKPENRYITINNGYSTPSIVKIHFNKEYDANKLRAKINSAVKSKEDSIEYRTDTESKKENNTTNIAKSYIDSGISDIANSISISKGQIKMYINGAIVYFDIKGEIIKFELNSKDANNESEMIAIFNDLNIMQENINKLSSIIKANPIPLDLIEWSLGLDNGSYIFKTLEYSKY